MWQAFTTFFNFLGHVIEWLVVIAEQALLIYTFYGLLSAFLDRELRRSTRIILSFFCYALLLVALFGLPRFLSSSSIPPPQESPFLHQYVSSKNSDIYHVVTCHYVENIYEGNRVYYSTPSKAEAAGKIPCSVCRPGK